MKNKNTLLSKIKNLFIKDLLIDFFSDPRNGQPDNITKEGCIKLAAHGPDVWNTWRILFPPEPFGHFHYKNISNFSQTDFTGRQNLEFSEFIFGDGADFSFCRWERHADFLSATWGDHCNFTGTNFGVRSIFDLATIGDNCDFTGCCWGHDCAFDKAKIGSNANFSNTYWGTRTYFNETHFGTFANFNLSIWDGSVSFSGSGASGLSNVTAMYRKDERTKIILAAESSKFFSKISFRGAKFNGEVFFDDRIFTDSADFSSFTSNSQCDLIKRNPDGSAVLRDGNLVFFTPDDINLVKTIFSRPPSFHGAKLHPNTSFDGVIFPKPEGKMYNARAYRTLKILFSKIQADSDVKSFKRLEIAEELACDQKNLEKLHDFVIVDFPEIKKFINNINYFIDKFKLKHEIIISKSLHSIEDHLLAERWGDAASNTRKVLESTLHEVALLVSPKKTGSKKIPIDEKNPASIRNFLKERGVLKDSEFKLITATYSFLSDVGAHPHKTTSNQANLAVSSGLSATEFVLQKLKEIESS